MEKYNEIIEEIRNIRGLRNAFKVEYDNTKDSIYLNFTNSKAFRTLDNEDSKMFERFKMVIDYNNAEYEFKSYGSIEIYFSE